MENNPPVHCLLAIPIQIKGKLDHFSQNYLQVLSNVTYYYYSLWKQMQWLTFDFERKGFIPNRLALALLPKANRRLEPIKIKNKRPG